LSTGQTLDRRSETEVSSSPILYNSHRQICLQLRSTTLIYYSALQSQQPITTEDPPTEFTTTTTVYRDYLRLQSRELLEVSFQESLILYKTTSLPQPLLRHILVNKDNITVLKPWTHSAPAPSKSAIVITHLTL
jgi:hypothetical protein